MSDFWNNILRYPRFFISSVSGLILVILTPFINLIKTPKSRILLLVFTTFLFITLFLILKNMLAV
jgi:hypothetical protein